MPVKKQKYYFILLVFLLLPVSVYSAWSEPTQAPTGGNAAVPIYSEGSGQTLNGTLHVDPSATNPTSLQGSGSTNGVQGNSVGNALFGNLNNNAVGGGRAVYGLAVDAADYGLYTSGGLGLGVASGDIWFLQQDQGIAWPRESDGAGLYGVYVTNTGELQVRGHGAGINFMDQNAASRLTVSEAGVVNVAAGGSLKVNNVSVCLQDGTNCPANVTPTLQQVTTAGNTSSNQILLTPAANVEALRIVTSNWSPLVVRNAADAADIFRVDQNGNASASGNITAAGQNVCRQDGTNCPAAPAPPAGASLWNPNGNDIYPNFSGNVKLNHVLQYNGDTGAEAAIDFDPFQGNLGNYFLIQSGISPTYGEKWHLRINRDGETLLGGNVFIGKGGSVASMTPYNDPTANVSWKFGLVNGVSTIEAEPGPGGNPGGRGDINLKTGTLSIGYASLQNDLFLKDGKSIQVSDPAPNTKIQIGNYNDGPVFAYGSGKVASLAVEGDVKGNQLCIREDCKSTWQQIVQAGSGAYWALSGSGTDLYPSSVNYNVGIGNSAPGAYKLNVSGNSYVSGKQDIGGNLSIQGTTFDANAASDLYINGQGNVQIRIDTNGGPLNNNFKIVNDQNSPVFSVDEWGYVSDITVIQVNGASTIAPLAVKTDASNGGIRVECSAGGCANNLELSVKSNTIGTIKTSNTADLILQPIVGPGINGGGVGIGTTAPNASALLHIKTDNGNAEFDIQSASSPYWGIYQDDGTDELRFFHNTANRMVLFPSGHVGIGPAGVASEQDIPLYVDSAGGLMGIGIYTDGTIVAGQTVSALRLQMTNGAGAGKVLTSNATGLAAWSAMLPASAYPSSGANPIDDADTDFIDIPNPPPPTGPYTNYVCQVGWVMIGIRSETSMSRIICGKLW